VSAAVKSVDWSYPSSENASRFGFAKTGCWTVKTRAAGSIGGAVAGFATANEALAFARGLGIAWCPMFTKYMSPTVRALFSEP